MTWEERPVSLEMLRRHRFGHQAEQEWAKVLFCNQQMGWCAADDSLERWNLPWACHAGDWCELLFPFQRYKEIKSVNLATHLCQSGWHDFPLFSINVLGGHDHHREILFPVRSWQVKYIIPVPCRNLSELFSQGINMFIDFCSASLNKNDRGNTTGNKCRSLELPIS